VSLHFGTLRFEARPVDGVMLWRRVGLSRPLDGLAETALKAAVKTCATFDAIDELTETSFLPWNDVLLFMV
jgi:hypothetical protein